MSTKVEEKAGVVELVEIGYSWQEAISQVGVKAGESTVFLWRKKWRAGGEAALADGRQGHRYKMTDEIREWLKGYCEAAPETGSGVLREEVAKRFGVTVSKGHVNLVRAEMGVSRPKKSRG